MFNVQCSCVRESALTACELVCLYCARCFAEFDGNERWLRERACVCVRVWAVCSSFLSLLPFYAFICVYLIYINVINITRSQCVCERENERERTVVWLFVRTAVGSVFVRWLLEIFAENHKYRVKSGRASVRRVLAALFRAWGHGSAMCICSTLWLEIFRWNFGFG